MGRGDAMVDGAAGELREAGGCLVVDGAMGTELEAHGADLQDELWSARCLVSAPHLIRKVHLDYLEAGANIITTASYQATLQGFQSREQSEALLRRSVEIARHLPGRPFQRPLRGARERGTLHGAPARARGGLRRELRRLPRGRIRVHRGLRQIGEQGVAEEVPQEAAAGAGGGGAGSHRLRDHPEQAGGAGLLRAPGGERHPDPRLVLLHLQGRSQRGERGPHHGLRRRRRLLQEGRRRRGQLHRSQADPRPDPRHHEGDEQTGGGVPQHRVGGDVRGRDERVGGVGRWWRRVGDGLRVVRGEVEAGGRVPRGRVLQDEPGDGEGHRAGAARGGCCRRRHRRLRRFPSRGRALDSVLVSNPFSIDRVRVVTYSSKKKRVVTYSCIYVHRVAT